MKQNSKQGKYAEKQSRLSIWLWVIPSITLVVGLCAIGSILLNLHKARSSYQQMADTLQEIRETTPFSVEDAIDRDPEETQAAVTEPNSSTNAETVTRNILAYYQRLADDNPDMVGWLWIEDSVINYPVMHTPEDPEKYLHRDFQGNYSYPGVPYIDSRCTEDSDNLLIYAHNMDDGSMFHTLLDYRNEDHWKMHPVIHFDSLTEEREYEVVAAFHDRVYYTHETNFKFYNFIDAANEAEYNKAVEVFKKKSIYDTGITPKYGQKLITLVTCSYLEENGRFVVLACEKTK